MINIKVNGCLEVPKENIHVDILDKFRTEFSIPNPLYLKFMRLKGQASPSILRTLPGYVESADKFYLFRYYEKELDSFLRINGLEPNYVNEIPNENKWEINIPDIVEGKLRPYQVEAVKTIIERRNGVIVAGCGAGKTTIGVALTQLLKTRTVVLVHTSEIFDQWAELFHNMGVKVGLYGKGIYKAGDVNIVMTHSLMNKHVDEVAKVRDCGLLIVDECHVAHYRHANFFNAPIKVGLTATPKREDGTMQFVIKSLGPTINIASHEQLVEGGFRVNAEYVQVRTKYVYPYTSRDVYTTMVKDLIMDPGRNKEIIEFCKTLFPGKKGLILTGSVKHCEFLAEQLNYRRIKATCISSSVKTTERFKRLDKMRKGEYDVLVATSVADVGLDVPILDTLILVYPGISATQHIQRVGRVLRPHVNKTKAIIYDFVDYEILTLRRQANGRKKHFNKMIKDTLFTTSPLCPPQPINQA